MSEPKVAPHDGAKTVSLALQGGGSHGAFTWGVLDALIEDGRVQIQGVSGASAGAMNAVALGHGYAVARANRDKGDAAAAREALSSFWEAVMDLGQAASSWQSGWLQAWTSSLSPYQLNPLDINPLRNLIAKQFDFEAIGKLGEPKVFITATHVNTGKAEIFSGKRLSADALMASACLPMVFQAVEIDGEHYWDGGFSGNPALHPLIYRCQASDVVLVQLNPLERNAVPTTSAGIIDRINELTFNASLLAQMRSIDFVNRMLEQGRLETDRYRPVRLHRIDGGEALEAYPAATKGSADAGLIRELHAMGREAGQRWLKRHWDEVGVKTSINIAKDYLDDMRMGSY
jgi:NTE family protein